MILYPVDPNTMFTTPTSYLKNPTSRNLNTALQLDIVRVKIDDSGTGRMILFYYSTSIFTAIPHETIKA
jgi:hypothetical protein